MVEVGLVLRLALRHELLEGLVPELEVAEPW